MHYGIQKNFIFFPISNDSYKKIFWDNDCD